MKIICITLCLIVVLKGTAQNKLAPIDSSSSTGIQLPKGSKQDRRSLFIGGAKIILEMVSEKKGFAVKNVEVLYVPVSYTIDSLKAAFQKTNWTVSAIDGETDFFWIQQNNKNLMAGFQAKKKANEIYFGETVQAATTAEPKNTVQKTNTTPTVLPTVLPTNTPVESSAPSSKTGFTFTTTNWEDGWSSTIKEDWVEVTKGNIKVLLHYPNKKADAYNSVLKDGDYNAWNILVAPRYSNLKNFEWKSIQSWESISFMQADATENGTGKSVHIVLFKKHYSNGNGRYLEFVSDSKATYENEFGPYHNTEFEWDKTANMQFRNKFSVAPNDLIGKWSTTDYASISYYYVNTGGLAGTTATSTADEFTFLPDNNYESDHSGASGMVGNMKFSRQVYKGKSTVTNWNITLTNRFQGDTEKYDSYFEAVKGGRALILTDHLNTVHTLVKQQ
jgi:hypothetical protein